ARARNYYEQMAQSLGKRMSAAQPDKLAGYQARLEHCHAERDRRLAEIEGKYRSSVECLPFRLHLVGVPALRVEGGIRRGSRWYPVDLEWLSALRRFAPVACPGCGSSTILVAGKAGLGCRTCQPPRLLESVPELTSPANPGAAAGKPRSAAPAEPAPPSVATSERSGQPDRHGAAGSEPDRRLSDRSADRHGEPARPVRTADRGRTADRDRAGDRGRDAGPRRGGGRAEPSPAAMTRTGSKLIVRLWEQVEAGDRSVARMCAPDGPAAALV